MLQIFFRFSFERSNIILSFVVYVSECFRKVTLSQSCTVCLWQIICFKSIFSLLSERFDAMCSQQLSFRYNSYQFYNYSLGLLQKLVGNILHAMKRDYVYGNTHVRYNFRYVDDRELKEGKGDKNGHQRCLCLRIWEKLKKQKNFLKVAGFFSRNCLFSPVFLNVFVKRLEGFMRNCRSQ